MIIWYNIKYLNIVEGKDVSMTSNERIKAALEGKEIDRMPWSPFLAYVWENFPQDIQDKGMSEFLLWAGADPMWRGSPCPVEAVTEKVTYREESVSSIETRFYTETPVGTLTHTNLKSSKGNTSFIFEHPVKNIEDLKIQQWIAEHTTLKMNLSYVDEHFKNDGKNGLSIGMLTPFNKTAFQSLVEYYIGTEELIYMMMDYPEEIDEYLKIQVELGLSAVKIAKESPYEYFLTWEDSSTGNYSPSLYEKYIAPEIKGYCDILKTEDKKYVQHACGLLNDILGIMTDSGIYCVESLSSKPTGNTSVTDARKLTDDKIAIIGGIEPVHFLETSEEDLPAYVHSVLEEAKGSRFVLANSDSCPPGVSPEKFRIVGDIVRGLK